MKSVATGKYKTLTEAWATAIRERGVLALWSGLGPELPRGIAMNATMMATREVLAPYNARWFA
jgi:methylmalonyl-CoA mutase cobalamin-binding subunit